MPKSSGKSGGSRASRGSGNRTSGGKGRNRGAGKPSTTGNPSGRYRDNAPSKGK